MATTGFSSEASSSYHTPRTPPYTPRRVKRPISRNDSPASTRSLGSAVQANATESPAKKAPKREARDDDDVVVEELSESDLGYIADNEIVYPNELEEAESRSEESDSSGDDAHHEGDVSSEDEIADPLSRLRCDDGEEAEFERKRRAKHVRRRTESRVFKRPHSLTLNVESEVTDPEALADQDLPESARRLRRRVRGPGGLEISVESLGSSPVAEAIPRAVEVPDEGRKSGNAGGEPATTDEMDVDDEE